MPPIRENKAIIQNTSWWPLAPGQVSKRYPMVGPANISGVKPINETSPTAVPVNAMRIAPCSITAKYKERPAYTPVAKIKIEMKNSF